MADYAVEFRTLAADVHWNKETFYNGLEETEKDKIAIRGKTGSLVECVNLAIELDNLLWERQRAVHSITVSPNVNPKLCAFSSVPTMEDPMQFGPGSLLMSASAGFVRTPVCTVGSLVTSFGTALLR